MHLTKVELRVHIWKYLDPLNSFPLQRDLPRGRYKTTHQQTKQLRTTRVGYEVIAPTRGML